MVQKLAVTLAVLGSLVVWPVSGALGGPPSTSGGGSATSADFDGDGFEDLAVGVPFDDPGGVSGAGVVNVLYGSSSGLTAQGDQVWHQDRQDIDDVAEVDDFFGWSLAAGDFDGDGFDDLAVGVRDENIGAISNAGAVQILYGSNGGLKAQGDQFWHQDSPGIGGGAETDDRFGADLAAGKLGNGSPEDLAIGVSFEDVGFTDAGAVHVLFGSQPAGLTDVESQLWTQDSPGVPDPSGAFDGFGAALTIGNFGRGPVEDLAIGANENVGAASNAGTVTVLFGSAPGVTSDNAEYLHQDQPGVKDEAEDGDLFGSALAAADLGRSGQDDLAIGIPGEVVGGESDAGAVAVLPGSDSGPSHIGDQFWHQNRPGINDSAQSGDDFGVSLAAADFGRSNHADLAIGVDAETVGGESGAGAVNVLYGTTTGLAAAGDQFWHQDRPGVNDSAETGDIFGGRLFAAKFGKGGRADLAIAADQEDVGGVGNAGAVNVLYGSAGGLDSSGDQFWHQDRPGVLGVAEVSDQFGFSL